ncbi:hypothetical protein SynMVIR181_00812 [Synechococcus sp. MVIR-18-1]|nr:hypothetical protein SynMVIR181_00812 [Synechococcus sp. MVIR-18-1]
MSQYLQITGGDTSNAFNSLKNVEITVLGTAAQLKDLFTQFGTNFSGLKNGVTFQITDGGEITLSAAEADKLDGRITGAVLISDTSAGIGSMLMQAVNANVKDITVKSAPNLVLTVDQFRNLPAYNNDEVIIADSETNIINALNYNLLDDRVVKLDLASGGADGTLTVTAAQAERIGQRTIEVNTANKTKLIIRDRSSAIQEYIESGSLPTNVDVEFQESSTVFGSTPTRKIELNYSESEALKHLIIDEKTSVAGITYNKTTKQFSGLHANDVFGFDTESIDDKLQVMEGKIDTTANLINDVQTDIAGVKTDVGNVKTDVATLKTDVQTDIAGVKTDVGNVKTDVATLDTVVDTAKTDLSAEIAALDTVVDTAKTDLSAEIAALDTVVDTAKTNLSSEIKGVKDDVAALDTVVDTAKTDLSAEIAALDTVVDTAKTNLSSEIAALDTVVDTAKTNLSSEIAALDTVVDAVQTSLNSQVETLRVHIQRNNGIAVTGNSSDLSAAFKGVTGYSGDVTFTDVHTLAQLKTVNNATSGTITLNDYTVDLSGSSADVTAALAGTFAATYTGAVTLTNAPDVTQLKAINGATTGAITLGDPTGALSGTAADLVAAFAGTVTTHTGTVKITDATTVSQLKTINAETTGRITRDDVTNALEGTAEDLAAALDGAITAQTGTIKITDAPTLRQLRTINGASNGAITLGKTDGALSGTAADIILGFAGTVTTHTGTVRITDAPTVAQLKEINAETTGAITLADANGPLEGKAADLVAAFAGTVTPHTGTVTITDEPTVTQLKAINAATTGAITLGKPGGPLEGTNADLGHALLGITGHIGSVTFTDNHDLNTLKAVAGSTSGQINLKNYSMPLNGKTADIKDVLTENLGSPYLGNVIFTDNHTLNELEIINNHTEGAITLHDNTIPLTGSGTKVAAALKGMDPNTYKGVIKLETAATISEIAKITAVKDGKITLDNSIALEGGSSDVAATINDLIDYKGNVKLEDTHNIGQLLSINQRTSGTITLKDYEVELKGSATDVKNALSGDFAAQYTGPVTIQNAHTLAELKAINGATTGTITLTDYSVPLTGSATDIESALSGTFTSTYTGNINLTTPHDLKQLKAINNATTGRITLNRYDIPLTGTAIDVAAAMTGNLDHQYDAQIVLSTAPTIAELKTINDATKGKIVLQRTNTHAKGIANDIIDAFKGDINVWTGPITINDAINVSQLKTINSIATGGDIFLKQPNHALTGTAADLDAAFAGAVRAESGVIGMKITITDKPNLDQLKHINSETNGEIELKDTSGALSGKAADLVDAFAGTITKYTGEITIEDGTNLSALKFINDATNGTIKLGVPNMALSGEVADLVLGLDGITSHTGPITITNAKDDAITAADLIKIGGATTGTVTVTNAIAITGTTTEVNAALLSGSSVVDAPKATVTITGNPSVTQLNSIAAKTDGVVTATLAPDTLTNLGALATDSTDNITVTVNDNAGTAVTAANLSALGNKTAGTVTVSKAVAITGSKTELTAALVTAGSKVVVSDAVVTVNDADATAVTAKELSDIGGATAGTVTVSNAVAISGTESEVTAALVTESSKVVAAKATATISGNPAITKLNTIAAETTGVVKATLAADTLANLGALNTASTDDITVTVNDNAGTAVTAANLSALGNKTAGTVTVQNPVAITGSAAEVTAALVTEGSKVEVNKATVTITGNPSISELNAIATKTTGVITTTLANGKVADFNSLATAATDDISITLTDADGDALAAADLSTLAGKTNKTISLDKAVVISGTSSEINTALAGTEVKASKALVSFSDNPSIALLNTIAGKTTGAVTATLAPDTLANLEGLTTDPTDKISITVGDGNGAEIAATKLSALGGKTGTPVSVANAIAISGTESEVTAALVTEGSRVVAAKATATISGNPDISKLNAIALKTTGAITTTLAAGKLASFGTLDTDSADKITVTVNDADGDALAAADLSALGSKTAGTVSVTKAVAITGSAAELTAALVNANTRVEVIDAVVTVNDNSGTLTAKALSDIGGATTGTVTVTNAVAITGTTAEVLAALVSGGSEVVAAKATVTITGSPTVSDLNKIAAKTDGVITATLAADSLQNLGALTTASTDNITVTVNDADATAVTATDLSTLGGKTAGTVTVTNAVAISGTESEVTAALVTSGSKVVAAKATATISGNPAITKLNDIALKTTGVITTTLADGSLASFGALATDSTDNIKVTVNDADGTAVAATDLSALGNKTAGTVDVSKAVAITGSAAELTAALVTPGSGVGVTNAVVTVNDADATAVTAKELSAIGAATTGTVTVTNAVAITGSKTELKAALVTPLTRVEVTDAVVTVNDADGTAVTAKELSDIGGATTGTVTVTNAVAISGTESEVTAALVTASSKVVAAKATATISGNPAITKLNDIANKTTGVITTTLADGSLASFGALATDSADKITVTVNDADGTAVTATDLSTLGGKTAGTVTVSEAVAITGSKTELTAALVTAGSKVVVSDAVVTVNDNAGTAFTAKELSDIGAATTGTVTVTKSVAITGSKTELTAALVTTGSKVVAATSVVTVNDADSTAITAKELSDIGAATAGTVTVTNAVAISGTESEVTAALVTESSKVVAAKATATISGNSAITKLNAIAAETTGVVKATLAADTLTNLGALATDSTDDITVTVNDNAGTAVTAANLSALGNKTAGTVTVSKALRLQDLRLNSLLPW